MDRFTKSGFFVRSKLLVDEGLGDGYYRFGKIVYKRSFGLVDNMRLHVESQVERLERQADRGGEGIWPGNTCSSLAYGPIM